jgi:hypothetical protein
MFRGKTLSEAIAAIQDRTIAIVHTFVDLFYKVKPAATQGQDETEYLLASPSNHVALMLARQQVAQGKTVKQELVRS